MISRIKMELFIKEISQSDIARAANVHRAYINRIVNGHQKPSKKVIKAFQEIAGIELDVK